MGKREKRRKIQRKRKRVRYKVGDLVRYYPAHGGKTYVCIIQEYHDLHGLLFVLYDLERGFSFITSKSCIKKLDKSSEHVSG